jgi:hypothetical protein
MLSLQMTELEFWNHRFNELRDRCDPQTDVQLSFLIRISPAMISQIRTGRREPPFEIKIKILEELGYAFDHDLLIRMLPSDHRRSIISAMKKRRNGTLEFPSSINNGKELPPLSDI